MTYETEVLADSPDVFYILDEASGSTIVDSSGNGYDGTYQGTPSFNDTAVITGETANTGFTSTGSAYGQVSNSVGTHPAPFTFEFLFTDLTGGSRGAGTYYLVSTQSSTVDRLRVEIDESTTPWTLTATILDYSALTTATLSYQLPSNGGVYHVAVVVDGAGTAQSLYVNGSEVATDTANLSAVSLASTGKRIAGLVGGKSADAAIGYYAEYSSALSSARISAHYAAATGVVAKSGSDTATVSDTGDLDVYGSNPYLTEILTDSPTLVWPLDETSGTTAADATGNGNTGTYNGGTLASGGLIGPDPNARLDSGEYIVSDSAIAITIPFTLEVWTEWDASTVNGLWGRPDFAGFYDSPNDYALIYGFAAQGAGSTQLSTVVNAAVSSTSLTSGASVLTRSFLALTVTSTTATLYVNGVEVDSATADFSSYSSNHVIGIGSSTGMFSGLVGYFALYPSALSAARIAAHYAARDQHSTDAFTFTESAYLSFDKSDSDTASAADADASLTVGFSDTDTATAADTGYPTKQYTGSDTVSFNAYISGTVASTYTGDDRAVASETAVSSGTLPPNHPLASAQIRPTFTAVDVAANTTRGVVHPVVVDADVAANTSTAVIG